MNIRIIVTGKTSESYVRQGVEDYLARINRYVPVKLEVVQDLKNLQHQPIELIKKKESEKILEKIPADAIAVLLDERGKSFTSREFAGFIQKQLNSGKKQLIFIAGGSYGVDLALKNRADHILSLSEMTFSHELVRLVFTEQLYRAFSILRNEKYHHD
ncbi:MAG: 23S rRNA (pseudouridine(1915)-N(3))-methyltransferase RlmH [Bacteroidetes bacterium]|nr:23S rRNA (pseudouridine(1915)-N(3))-methyltransferase RlmH [Bacteroidota bacterium]